jgi:hypothetical protein
LFDFRTLIRNVELKFFDLPNFDQVDEELRTYGSATELTGSTATAILIKHGDLYCANLVIILPDNLLISIYSVHRLMGSRVMVSIG